MRIERSSASARAASTHRGVRHHPPHLVVPAHRTDQDAAAQHVRRPAGAAHAGVDADAARERITTRATWSRWQNTRCSRSTPPSTADRGYRGVKTVLGTVDGLKRFIAIRTSPYHGLNFCQGTVSESEEAGRFRIRYFGRAARSSTCTSATSAAASNFRETFGADADMLKAMRVYKESASPMIIPPVRAPA